MGHQVIIKLTLSSSLLLLSLVGFVFVAACAAPTLPSADPSGQTPTAEPKPSITTQSPTPTPYPTSTPYPTYTLYPTHTPYPPQLPTSATQVEPRKETDNRELRYLALGDSYTIGQSVDISERWPAQLARRLREASINVADAQIIARTGWTTEDLAKGIEVASPVGPFDIVTLSIGVNNQYQSLDINQYEQEFAALLKSAVKFAGDRPSHVIVVSIPDWGITPFASGLNREEIGKEIDQFNMINREETTLIGATYIDVTGISREAGTEPDLLATDGLHPSGKMYSRWVDLILPVAISTRQNGP